ncbi:MAG TPA: C25 family cysteine peptidase, partial [Chitinophagaceae bacterium]|nr:C25 family cysteine peptidase [Chitinophagaceae bacterium]
MKKIFTICLLLAAARMMGQQYNNEWINFNQTYYKFKVGVSGLYRIPQATIVGAGLGSSQVQYMQLWRNGKQVPFYSTVASGTLGAGDYLEFWGEANDGKPDRPLYRDAAYQHTDKISLETDTAMFFLTISPNINPVRFIQITNDVASNVLPVEPYLWFTTANYYKSRINSGVAAVVGEYVFSSSYDKGEFWSTSDIFPSTPNIDGKNNLAVYAGGPDALLKWGASGNALNPRHVRVSVNGNLVADTVMDYFNDVSTSTVVPLGMIAGSTSSVQFVNTSSVASDRMVISYYELSYPRRFLFNLQKNFTFELPAKSQGYYLEIQQFDAGSATPVLYDLTNNNRIVADVSGGTYRFVVPALSTTSQFVLVSEDASNIISVNSVTSKNFINFSDTTYQGDYLIISNPLLYNGTHGNNPVIEYRNYRRTTNGGAFNAKVIDINELVDQFAFGIKKHPLSIRNFLSWARMNFTTAPKFAFLIGHGLTYVDHRKNESNPVADQLNLVPTFGYPGSDNKLGADDAVASVTSTPIGRLSVVYASEIENYLEKVIEYETVQRTAPQSISDRNWMKNVMHVTGASDPYLGSVLCNYMTSYKAI